MHGGSKAPTWRVAHQELQAPAGKRLPWGIPPTMGYPNGPLWSVAQYDTAATCRAGPMSPLFSTPPPHLRR